jgi:hypothetical protein
VGEQVQGEGTVLKLAAKLAAVEVNYTLNL